MGTLKRNNKVNGVRSFAGSTTARDWFVTEAVAAYNKATNLELAALEAAQRANAAKRKALNTELASDWAALKAKGVVA